jgi:hypothetical protein
MAVRRALFLAALMASPLLQGCAALSGPPPLTRENVVAMAKAGESPQAMIDKLRDTGTVLPMSASEILRLHQAGVPSEVLDYLQVAQIAEARRREAMFSGMYACPWGARIHPLVNPRAPAHLPSHAPWSMGLWGPC